MKDVARAVALPYVQVEEARDAGGLRIVLSRGAPGPWSEAVKAFVYVKGLHYLPVGHHGGTENSLVHAWTGIASAPVAMFAQERPRGQWDEILLLLERMQPEPRLIPADQELRSAMFGVAHEICGEEGLGWSRRRLMLDSIEETATAVREAKGVSGTGPNAEVERMRNRYDGRIALDRAVARMISVLRHLSDTLAKQRRRGRENLIGDHLSGADIYWAAFSNLFVPLEPSICPMPNYYRQAIEALPPAVRDMIDPALIAHRDRIIRSCFELPMRF